MLSFVKPFWRKKKREKNSNKNNQKPNKANSTHLFIAKKAEPQFVRSGFLRFPSVLRGIKRRFDVLSNSSTYVFDCPNSIQSESQKILHFNPLEPSDRRWNLNRLNCLNTCFHHLFTASFFFSLSLAVFIWLGSRVEAKQCKKKCQQNDDRLVRRSVMI